MTNAAEIARIAEGLTEARKFAVQALQSRLKLGDPRGKNEKIKARIALIRAERLDDAVEVQSALLAVRAHLEANHDD